jgi:hypothetical protein
MPPTTVPIWEQVAALPLRGNLIPHPWYRALTFPSGKPDLVAITLLAEIVYWYRPVVERDTATGQVRRLHKKFKADMLQYSYRAFAEKFSFTKRQVMEAIYRLEKTYGVLHKELRHVDTPYGRYANALFVCPIMAVLRAITCEQGGSHVPVGDVSQPVGTRLTAHRRTNTETTPKSSQKISGFEDDSAFLAVEEEDAFLPQAEDTGHPEDTSEDVSIDMDISPEGTAPLGPSAVIIPLFPSRTSQASNPTSRDAPVTPAPSSSPLRRARAAPVADLPEARQAHQDEAVLRAQFAALPAAQQAWLTHQAQQELTRRGVPAWLMGIAPVVEATIWELLQAASADETGGDVLHDPRKTLVELSLVPCESARLGRGSRSRRGRSLGWRQPSPDERPQHHRAQDGLGRGSRKRCGRSALVS